MKEIGLGGLNAQIAIILIVAALVVVGIAVMFAPQPATPSAPVSPPPIIIPTGPGPVITPEMNFTTTAECGIGKPCKTGSCIDAGEGPQCIVDPCALCDPGDQCIILESYPGQLRCIKPGAQAPEDNDATTAESFENLSVTLGEKNGVTTAAFSTKYDVCEDENFEWNCLTESSVTTCQLNGVNAPATTPSTITVTCLNYDTPLNKMVFTGTLGGDAQ